MLAALMKPSDKKSFLFILFYFIQVHIVIVLAGTIWMAFYIGSISDALSTALDLQAGVIIKSLVGAGLVWFISLNKTEIN